MSDAAVLFRSDAQCVTVNKLVSDLVVCLSLAVSLLFYLSPSLPLNIRNIFDLPSSLPDRPSPVPHLSPSPPLPSPPLPSPPLPSPPLPSPPLPTPPLPSPPLPSPPLPSPPLPLPSPPLPSPPLPSPPLPSPPLPSPPLPSPPHITCTEKWVCACFFRSCTNNYLFLSNHVYSFSNNIKYSCDWLQLEYCVLMQNHCQMFL